MLLKVTETKLFPFSEPEFRSLRRWSEWLLQLVPYVQPHLQAGPRVQQAQRDRRRQALRQTFAR